MKPIKPDDKKKLPFVTSATSKGCAIVNGKSYPGVVSNSIQNVILLVENDNQIKDCLIYNIFADDVFLLNHRLGKTQMILKSTRSGMMRLYVSVPGRKLVVLNAVAMMLMIS
jgi:hypothetical protein